MFTEWFDLGKYAGSKLHGQLHRAGGVAEFPNITADFVTSTDSLTRKVVIELATAPDARAVVKRFEETFTGSLTSFLVSPRLSADKDSLETASQMTRRRLAWAREASGGPRVSPSQLIVQTSFWNPQRPELNLQEAEVLWLLGFNVVNRWPEVRAEYDFADPGWPSLGKVRAESHARGHRQSDPPGGPGDPGLAAAHAVQLLGRDHVPGHRQRHGCSAALSLLASSPERASGGPGVKALDDVVPIESPDVFRQRQVQDPKAANRIFYYTARFRQAAATERLRWLTESFHRYAAAIMTSTLVADHPYFSGSGLGMGMDEPNMAWGNPLSLDWFDLARQRAVDVIGIEDWMGLQYMYGPALHVGRLPAHGVSGGHLSQWQPWPACRSSRGSPRATQRTWC